MCFPILSQLVLLCAVCGCPDDAAQEAARKKTEKLCTDAIVKFYDAFENRDLDALIAALEVPWFHDGKAVLSSKEDVRTEFKVLLAKRRDVKQRKMVEIKAVLPYGAVREHVSVADRSLLDQVVKEHDFFVLVMLKPEAGSSGAMENVVVLVRIQDGVPKIVGVKN